jgi:hypothetical protein
MFFITGIRIETTPTLLKSCCNRSCCTGRDISATIYPGTQGKLRVSGMK